MAARTVLVTGATGKQGGPVARTLLSRGHRVRALVRDPGTDAAKALAVAGAALVVGDFDDTASLRRAIDDTDAVFLMATPFAGGPEAETRQGNAVIDAAAAVGTGHLIYSSVSDADRATGIPHFESKYEIEQYLVDAGVPWTIVAPVFFMDNFASSWMGHALRGGTLSLAMPGDRVLQYVDVGSIARFVATVLERGRSMFGARINIAGDQRTGEQAAAILGAVIGVDVKYVEQPLAQVMGRSEDLGRMMQWFTEAGYSADVEGLRRDYPEVGWLRLDEWAQQALA